MAALIRIAFAQSAHAKALTAKRLRFYDSLNPTRQAVVPAEVVACIEKLERLRDALVAFPMIFWIRCEGYLAEAAAARQLGW